MAPSPQASVDGLPGSYGVGTWLRIGFALLAALETSLHAAAFSRGVRTRALLLALQFTAGHILALGLACAALAEAGRALLPRRRWLPPVATAAVAVGAAFLVLDDDLSVFRGPQRIGLTLAAAVPFVALVAARPLLARRRWPGALLAALSLGAGAANPFALSSEYAGVHLTLTLLAGLGVSLGLEGALAGRALPQGRRARVARTALLAYAALWAATSVVVWPSARVLLALLRYPAASVNSYLSHLRHNARGTPSLAEVPEAQRPWFSDRSAVPDIPPSQPPLAPARPIVILLTVDALRYDVFRDRPEAANLRRIADHGADFTMARSCATATIGAITSLFAGRTYSALTWTKKLNGTKLRVYPADDGSIRFPSLLGTSVQTTLLATSVQFEQRLGVTGGFDQVVRRDMMAPEVVDEVLAWYGKLGDRSGLVYAHLMDPHYPYDQAGTDGTPFENYLGEIGIVDRELGRLYDAIQASPAAERTYLVVSADHGEAFGEHGTTQHRYTVYEELTRVPMLVVGPGVKARRVAEPVSLIDLGPTVLDLFRVPTPGLFTGQSLVPLLRGDDLTLDRPIVVDSEGGKQAMVFRDGLKVIRDTDHSLVELYDLNRDPKEDDSLADEKPGLTARRLGTLAAFVNAHQAKLQLPGRARRASE